MKRLVDLFGHPILSQMAVQWLALFEPLPQLAEVIIGSHWRRQRAVAVQRFAQQRQSACERGSDSLSVQATTFCRGKVSGGLYM